MWWRDVRGLMLLLDSILVLALLVYRSLRYTAFLLYREKKNKSRS